MKRLPISVIIPTLNCREKLERHLDASTEWLAKVEQIIAIDSNSNDGTFELLQERLSVFKAQVISTGPGLYKAWNLGVSKATQPYVYFSTIGEILQPGALNRMCQHIQSEDFDVLITPPRMVDEQGGAIDMEWPIHGLKELLLEDRITVPTSEDLFVLTSLYVPESIIGSSASNLYRREILNKCPFPENVGVIGDVIWALENLPFLRVCFCGNMFATFCLDGDRDVTWEKLCQIMFLIRDRIRDLVAENGWPKNSITLSIEKNIIQKCGLINNLNQYEKWISCIYSSRINQFKIKYIDSFSLRNYLKRIFS